jgi:hypothetical protein
LANKDKVKKIINLDTTNNLDTEFVSKELIENTILLTSLGADSVAVDRAVITNNQEIKINTYNSS